MRLKELEIQGFKSFPDRTKVLIGSGITGVVGPNGSGKSNISDAIRWVMGETSSRQLRGSGKMEDVIFGGTQTRNAMGYASVTLTLDNTDHSLAMEADEVKIGRKYYRSGDSEYSLNGQSVRLKDVYELLLDTGLGRDGYAIIGQGRIAEIVGAKSAERREIFEEASGISKFRYRKNEAERRLAAAQSNLERLHDIVDELAKRVGPLKRDSEKAQQFLQLAERRKTLDVTLWMENIRRAGESVRDQQRKYEAAHSDYKRLSEELNRFDEKTEELHSEAQRLLLKTEQANGEIRTLTEQSAENESRMAVLQTENAHSTAQIEQAQAELQRAGRTGESIEAERQQHLAEMETIRGQMAALEAALQALQGELTALEQKALQSGERQDVLNAAMARCQSTATAARVRAAAAETARNAAEQQLAEKERQSEEWQQNAAAAAQKRDTAAAALKAAAEAVQRSDNIKAGLKLKLESRRRQLNEANEALQRTERERSMDGYQQSVKAVMNAAAKHRLRGIIGPVAGILTVEKGYETAIETALGFALQNIVVENQGCARAAITFLKDERAGRATFLPLDTVQGGRFTGSLTGTAEVAADLVKTEPQYRHLAEYLLGRIIVVEDLTEASAVAKHLNYRNRIVTLDGQVINAGGSFTGGSTARSVGVFSRRQELEELREKLEKLTQQCAAAQKDCAARKAEADRLNAELVAAESEGMTAAAEKLRAEMEVQQLNRTLAQAADSAARLQAEREELTARQQKNGQEYAEAEQERTAAEAELQRLTAEWDSLGADAAGLTAKREQLNTSLNENRLARVTAEKDISLHQAALQTLESRSGEAESRRRELNAAVEAANAKIAANNAAMEQIQRNKAEAADRIAAAEAEIRAANAARMQNEAALARFNQENRTLTDQRERMSTEMAHLAERRDAAEAELNAAANKLWEEYQLTEQEAGRLCIQFDSLPELRRQAAEVKGKIRALGNVNVGAIEEYKEVKERYEFMSAQVGDVEKARTELNKMIAGLNSEMEALFGSSFKEINRHFGQIFRELFGGGHAKLYLSDEKNLLESGIEIEVSPPGKVIKNLSALSGGEQALVAIAIYFAILHVNPSPFCILDEIEAALDDVNVVRYAQYLRRMTDNTQFIVITHRRGTMEAADVLYGVTMQEDGVSKILRLDLENVSAELVS